MADGSSDRARRFPRSLLLQALLALAGIALSAISLYHYTLLNAHLQVGPSFCNINAALNCDAVNLSKWSRILGVPIASYGLVFYCGLLLACVHGSIRHATHRLTDALFVVSLFGVLFSIYLFAVSKLAIGTLCPTCLALYAVNIAFFLSAWLAGLDRPLFARAGAGFSGLLAFPGELLRGGEEQRFARVSVILLALLAIVAAAAPQIVIVLSPPPAPLTPSSGVDTWARQKLTDLSPYISASGANVDHSHGPEDAPVQIFEFSDFECPACQRFFHMVEELMELYPGKIRLIYKNYPLDEECNPAIREPFHEHSCLAAGVARCAGEQGKFYEAARYIFSLPHVGEEALRGTVSQLGLDGDAVNECLASSRLKDKIALDLEQAESLYVSGTPSIWVNGRKIRQPTLAVLRSIVERILADVAKS